MNPSAASPNWWEVTRGNLRLPEDHALQTWELFVAQGGFLKVPSVALQVMPETLATQPPLSQAQVALDQLK